MKHGGRGDIDEPCAVVKRHELHAWRQRAIAVDLLNFGLDPRNDIVGVERPVHDEDGGHGVVIVIAAGFAEPGHVAHIDLRHILDLYGHAVELAECNILNVFDTAAEDEIGVAAVVDQANAADVYRLLADIEGARPYIDVGVADGAHELGQGHVIGFELVEIGLNLEFLRGAAPGIHLHDARHRQETALQDPILDRTQIGDADVLRPCNLIAIDFADEARCLNLGLDVVGQVYVLQEADLSLLQREIIIDTVLKSYAHKGKAIKRGRANIVHTRRRRQPDFHGNSVKPLHFFRRKAGGLSRDFEDDRSGVWICLDIQLCKGYRAANAESQQQEQHDRPACEPKCNKCF